MTHPAAWLAWALGASALAWATRHPLALAGALIAVLLVERRCAGGTRLPLWLPPLVALGAVFNAAWARAGNTALLRVPDAVPLLGGAITLEALAYGALNGLAIGVLLLAFRVFNRMVSVRALVGMLPPALGPIAVVTAIGLSYVPVTMRRARGIREASQLRGREPRGLRAQRALLMPLLASGLEHALTLSEAMAARGGLAQGRAQAGLPRMLVLAGALLCAVGLLARDLAAWPPATALLVIGAGIAVAALLAPLGGPRRSTYRQQGFAWQDAAGAMAAALPALAFAGWPALAAIARYSPYPGLSLPAVHPGFMLVGLLAVPALFNTQRAAPPDDHV